MLQIVRESLFENLGRFLFITISFFSIGFLGCQTMHLHPNPQTPIDCVNGWIGAIRSGDISQANSFLTKRGSNIKEYSGKEALEFWQDEIAGEKFSFDAQGFKGKWIEKTVTVNNQEYVFVFPILSDGPSSEAIWVKKENGKWRIDALFKSVNTSHKLSNLLINFIAEQFLYSKIKR